MTLFEIVNRGLQLYLMTEEVCRFGPSFHFATRFASPFRRTRKRGVACSPTWTTMQRAFL